MSPTEKLSKALAVQTGSEEEVLVQMIVFQRLEMVRIASDLTDDQGHWRPHPDANSIAGMLSHLTWVERYWFGSIFRGEPDLSTEPGWPGFSDAAGRSMEELIAAYTSAWQRSDEVWGTASLDDEVPNGEHGPTSLRWIVVHMIEETARHAGHADITRQMIDGFRAS